MVKGSAYVVGLAHVETGHRITASLVLSLEADLHASLNAIRAEWETTNPGYDVEFAVGQRDFMDTYGEDFARNREGWPAPAIGYAF